MYQLTAGFVEEVRILNLPQSVLEKVFAGRADATCRKFGGRIPGLLLTSITLLGFGFATGE